MGKFFDALYEELKLYVRMMAWLSAVPENQSLEKGAKKATRLELAQEERKDKDYFPEVPPCNAYHIVAYLFEIGPVMQGGMGPASLTEQEVASFQSNSGIELQAIESKFIRLLSKAYLKEQGEASKVNAPPPWSPTVDAPREKKEDVAKRIRALLRS